MGATTFLEITKSTDMVMSVDKDTEWTVLDETRTAFPMFLVQKAFLGVMSLEEIAY